MRRTTFTILTNYKELRDAIKRHEIARAAGADEANRQMRREGRTAWSREDYNLACQVFDRLFSGLSGKGQP